MVDSENPGICSCGLVVEAVGQCMCLVTWLSQKFFIILTFEAGGCYTLLWTKYTSSERSYGGYYWSELVYYTEAKCHKIVKLIEALESGSAMPVVWWHPVEAALAGALCDTRAARLSCNTEILRMLRPITTTICVWK